MRKGRIYIAGPMRGIKDFNAPAFDDAEVMLHWFGWETFSPSAAAAKVYGEGTRVSPTGDEDVLFKIGYSRRAVFLQDTSWICEQADAVYMLPGWEASLGARAEWALAQALGLVIHYAPEQPEAPELPA